MSLLRQWRYLTIAVFAIVALAAFSACGGDSPEALAKRLENALKAGDMDAAIGLIQWHDSPAELRFHYLNLLPQCFERHVCTATLGPLTDEFRGRTAKWKTQGAEFAVAPEGTIEVSVLRGNGEKVWSEQRPVSDWWDSAHASLVLLVPASVLEPGRYRLEIRREGEPSYASAFTVTPPAAAARNR